MSLSFECCELSGRDLRGVEHSFGVVLPNMCVCVCLPLCVIKRKKNPHRHYNHHHHHHHTPCARLYRPAVASSISLF
jgi:hypothetical protein